MTGRLGRLLGDVECELDRLRVRVRDLEQEGLAVEGAREEVGRKLLGFIRRLGQMMDDVVEMLARVRGEEGE